MKNFHAVLFDIDDTLIDFEKSQSLSLKDCYEKYFSKATDYDSFHFDFAAINADLWHQVESHVLCPSQIGKMRFDQITSLYEMPPNPEISPFYENELVKNSDWTDGAKELLGRLKEQGVKIGFVTNGFAHVQKQKSEKFALHEYSDILVISEEVGFSKPHPKIFEHTKALINEEFAHTLMVGDRITSDGIGAKNIGMPFCWYNPKGLQPPEGFEPEMTIDSFKALF